MFSPTIFPLPCTILSTPLGNPTSIHIFANSNADIGVISDGFATTVFPAANAGAIFHVNKYNGKFQGEIAPTTPKGCFKVKFKLFWSTISWLSE